MRASRAHELYSETPSRRGQGKYVKNFGVLVGVTDATPRAVPGRAVLKFALRASGRCGSSGPVASSEPPCSTSRMPLVPSVSGKLPNDLAAAYSVGAEHR